MGVDLSGRGLRVKKMRNIEEIKKDVQELRSPYKTVQVYNFNKLHIIAAGDKWRKIRCLQSKTVRYFQTCIAL